MQPDTSLFADIADTMGIGQPAIIEKDYWAIQLLSKLAALEIEGYQFVFAGGTCLAKTHTDLCRMSEDIDIKLVPSEETLTQSKEKQKGLRKGVGQLITNAIEQSDQFSLIPQEENPIKRDSHKFHQWLIGYPRTLPEEGALRPHLQLELTESILLEAPEIHSFGSFYAKACQLKDEVSSMPCVPPTLTAAEKFVALLRRTMSVIRDDSQKDDETLVRHVYDLHMLHLSIPNLKKIQALIARVIETDKERFGRKHPEFMKNPEKELLEGLQELTQNTLYKDRYERFIGPLVYHPSPTKWEEAIKSLNTLAIRWIPQS